MKTILVYGYARKSPDDKESTETSINNQIRLFETTNNVEIKDPINKNLRAVCAARCCGPKKKFNATPGKKNIKIKIGSAVINIHLFTCLLSCFII